MKERPIIFSAPMVRAILDGRKTQARRIVKPAPGYIESSGRWKWPMPRRLRKQYPNCPHVYTASREWWQYLPAEAFPVQTGDVLWVREAWEQNYEPVNDDHVDNFIIYRADDNGRATDCGGEKPWTPAIHMPKWASRIRLTVKNVRVERVQDISALDCAAEGVEYCHENGHDDCFYGTHGWVCSFSRYWDTINAKRGYSWGSNPWVWRYEFERIGEAR